MNEFKHWLFIPISEELVVDIASEDEALAIQLDLNNKGVYSWVIHINNK